MPNPRSEEFRPRSKVKKRDEEESGILHNEPFLPDDIIMDIVSRLPTKDAFRFQCLCKRGRSLMASRDFINSHNKRSVPMILVLNSPFSRQPFLLDKCWESERKKSKIQKSCRLYPDHIMELSQDGLIVSKKHNRSGIFIIFNPIYTEIVKITVPTNPHSEILGVFYQPSIKEYCTLWETTVSSGPLKVRYKLLNLGSQPYWRDITNPWTQNGRIQDIRPIMVNGYLYWVVEPEEPYFREKTQHYYETSYNVDILEFDTRTEVFEVIPCPVPVNCKSSINLLQANGLLLLVHVCRLASDIDIWTLEDRVNKIWTSITIKEVNEWHCIKTLQYRWHCIKAVAFWDGELVVQSSASDLFVCNLKLGTTRKFGRTYFFNNSFASHVMSLASLENCKSTICLVEEGKENPVKTGTKQTDHLVR